MAKSSVGMRFAIELAGPNLLGEQGMPRTLTAAALVAACVLALVAPAAATSRIKDLANFEGVRQNQLIGYGLVVGLNGTGDTLQNIPFTRQSIQAMLERMASTSAAPRSV